MRASCRGRQHRRYKLSRRETCTQPRGPRYAAHGRAGWRGQRLLLCRRRCLHAARILALERSAVSTSRAARNQSSCPVIALLADAPPRRLPHDGPLSPRAVVRHPRGDGSGTHISARSRLARHGAPGGRCRLARLRPCGS